MNKFIKTAALAMGSAMLLSAPASAQITSIGQLLDQVRQDAATQQRENQQRVAEFEAEASQQTRRLADAKRELAALESRANQVQGTFNSNQARIDELEAELKVEQGEFGEVFGLARTKAGEFKAMLDASIITAEYPNRSAVLGKIAESKALPTTDELNEIWQIMLQEIEGQRQVKTFTTDVANAGEGVEVVRVGPFNMFTKDGGEFLQYIPPKGEEPARVAKLPRQPAGEMGGLANNVANASPGTLVSAPIDPTRGTLLQSFDRVPTWTERIQQGRTIGFVLWYILLPLGVILGLVKIITLLLTSAKVRSQKRSAQASKGNPLGRIMMAADEASGADSETLELKMDEAILRESPRLEWGLNLLKLLAGIAPLLGLLGTVTGMIQTFQAMMIYGTGDPQLMAGGISEALVTTMLGLIVAIPLLVLHSFATSLARSVQSTLEEQSAGIIARNIESRRV